jgi:hypothetical protein
MGFDISPQPKRDDCLKPLGAGEVSRLPDALKRFTEQLSVINPFSPAFALWLLRKPPECPEKTQRMFAMIPAGGAKLVQNGCFNRSGGFPIPNNDGLQVFPF